MNIFAKVSRAEFTRLWEAGLSGTQIGDRLGISETSVRSIRKSFGLGDRRRGNALHTPETVEHVKRLWLENKSASNIARLMGPSWTRNMVIGMVHRHGFSEGRKTNAKPGAAAKAAQMKPVREPRPPKPPKAAKATVSQPFDLSKSKTDSTAEQRAEKAAAGRLIIKRTIDAANDNSVPMIGRSFGQCAWPVGTPDRAAHQMACGAPIYQGIEKCSYCLDHAQRAFARDITQPKPKENLERANRRWAA